MPWNEQTYKEHLKQNAPLPVYLFYGDEPYLTAHYAKQLAYRVLDGEEPGSFNFHVFDGQTASFDDIETAAETLPFMGGRQCVLVKDYDAAARSGDHDRMTALLERPPEECVLIFYQTAVPADVKKNAKWKAVLGLAEKSGAAVCLNKKQPAELVKILTAGATRRGCTMRQDTARLMVENCGDDLNLLLNELDKLCALAGGGEITLRHVEQLGTKNLEARVFDLAKAILRGQYTDAYTILHRLAAAREEPVMILGVLSNAFVDLVRVKAAAEAGLQPKQVAEAYTYRGREFVLQNAARDTARFSLETLTECVEILAGADKRLKSSRADGRVILDETAARLIVCLKNIK